jgi:hypothetical protein
MVLNDPVGALSAMSAARARKEKAILRGKRAYENFLTL